MADSAPGSHGVLQPNGPFENKESNTGPQDDLDPAMRGVIGRIDGKNEQHDEADGDGDGGHIGDAAGRGRGEELSKGGDKRLGHLGWQSMQGQERPWPA